MLQGPAPYGIEKRPMPSGFDLDQLLPKQVGPYTRTSMEVSSNRGVPATGVKLDGDSIYAHYHSGAAEIFVEFAINSRAEDAQSILDVAATESVDKFPTDPRFGSMGTEPSYLKVNNEYGALFVWTRGGYYFSSSAKSGEPDLDAFMQAFSLLNAFTNKPREGDRTMKKQYLIPFALACLLAFTFFPRTLRPRGRM